MLFIVFATSLILLSSLADLISLATGKYAVGEVSKMTQPRRFRAIAADRCRPSFLCLRKNRFGTSLVWTVARFGSAIKFWTRDLIAGNKVGPKLGSNGGPSIDFPVSRCSLSLSLSLLLVLASCVVFPCEQSRTWLFCGTNPFRRDPRKYARRLGRLLIFCSAESRLFRVINSISRDCFIYIPLFILNTSILVYKLYTLLSQSPRRYVVEGSPFHLPHITSYYPLHIVIFAISRLHNTTHDYNICNCRVVPHDNCIIW